MYYEYLKAFVSNEYISYNQQLLLSICEFTNKLEFTYVLHSLQHHNK